MRWKKEIKEPKNEREKITSPKYGNEVIEHEFLWLPLEIDGDVRWLESAYPKYVYSCLIDYPSDESLDDWVATKWCTKEDYVFQYVGSIESYHITPSSIPKILPLKPIPHYPPKPKK